MSRDDQGRDRLEDASRRGFLKATGALGATAGLGGIGSAHLDVQEEPDQTIELMAVADAWIGQKPKSIEGKVNPTLDLEAGKSYRVKWLNGDGASHNFSIFGRDSNLLVFSPFMHAQGDYQTVDFIATEAMTDYYCEVHYLSMRGSVEVSGTTNRTKKPVDAGYFPEGPKVEMQKVAGGFSYPVTLEVANEEKNRKFVGDQTGEVRVIDANGNVRDEPFLDLTDRVFQEAPLHPETGLLGLAFHPNFAENGKFYVRYSAPNLEGTPPSYHHTEVLSEFQADENLEQGSPDSENVLVTWPSPQSNHNSGPVDFGPNGLLYVPMGDGGFGGDTADMLGHVKGGNGQDIEENLLGSVLRFDPDPDEDQMSKKLVDKPIGVPQDNPLVGELDFPFNLQYAWGFRNPWGMSFDSEGRLFLADVGRSLFEEVNLVEKGGNYGWNIREGTHCFSPAHQADPPEHCATESARGEPLLDPIIEYPHVFEEKPVGQSVMGGHVYDGDAISELQGKYVFGDWSYSPVVPSGTLLVATPPEDAQSQACPPKKGDVLPGENEEPLHKENEKGGVDELWCVQQLQVPGGDPRLNRFVITFGQDDDGELYVLTNTTFKREKKTGEVHKIVPQGQGEGTQETTAGTTESAPNETTATETTTRETETTTGTQTDENGTTTQQ
jgi:glucose/arabinose dehydrogenase